MNNGEPNLSKSYNVDNDLSRGKEFITSTNGNIDDADLSIPNVNKAKIHDQEPTQHEPTDKATDENEPKIINDITRYLAIGEQSILLLKELGDLATLELTRSLEAIKVNIVLQLLLLPAIFLLYISVALSITYIIHIEFQSVYLTVMIFISSQAIGIIIVKYKIKKANKNIGFQKTSEQIYEVKRELFKSIKQTD